MTGDEGGDGGTDRAEHGDRGADTPSRAADLPPGYDEEDPYEGTDLETCPDWWRENAELYREHGLRPYRPPRFADGALATPLVEELDTELGVDVELRSVNPQRTRNCEVVVDGEPVRTVERSRENDGHTEYGLTAAAFEAAVRAAVDPDDAVGDVSDT